MTQTTAAMTFRAAAVDVSADNSTWVELDGQGAAVAVSGYGRPAPEQHTFDGDTPIVKAGKRTKGGVTVRFCYTEEALEGFEKARAIFETAGGLAYVRYSPGGDSTSGGASPFRFSTGAGVMTEFGYPQGEAAGTEILLCEFTVESPSLAKSVVA